jgi:flagellar FliJ protein
MKKFQFKFESILKLREHKVNLAKEDLAKVIKEKQIRFDNLKINNTEVDELLNSSTRDILFLQARNNRIEHIKLLNQKLNKEINNIEEIENVRREKLAKLLKEEKIMEKLKENDFEDFKKEVNKKDSDFIDEIANQRAYKR